MDVSAEITGVKYRPFLCRKLNTYDIKQLESAFNNDAAFIVTFGKQKQIALSWWVSAKRTRSYPYARVYDTLNFQGKKVTIIPILKDEGKEGDRDFLQWDTISLMSLLGVYVIVSYYVYAQPSSRYTHKITSQRFDQKHLLSQLNELLNYQSDPLHWNLNQTDKVGNLGKKALSSYAKISKSTGVEMHSFKTAEKRITELLEGKEKFMALSRNLAKDAQRREELTVQPKEKLKGTKASVTIKNYLGGYYFFTSDEVQLKRNRIYLIEGKHSKSSSIPSKEDIKEGLIKMILFTNLKNVRIGHEEFDSFAVLKLTSNKEVSRSELSKSKLDLLASLKKESSFNNFEVRINNRDLMDIKL